MITGLIPHMNVSPGQILKREMDSLNWSMEKLSKTSGISSEKIKNIINNKQLIDNKTAKFLGKAFNISKEFWLNLEQNHIARKKQ